jgi:threonine dehydratase
MERSVSSRKPTRTPIVKNKHQDILATIGNTPVVRINKLAPDHVNLFVKLEAFNPAGSVKDRLALAIIEDAEASGDLQPGQTVVEATSGNTGIGLAMVCAQKGSASNCDGGELQHGTPQTHVFPRRQSSS